MPNRQGQSDKYRYGFNGKERDDEVKGEGVQYDYGFRIYDPRVARFLSTDPLFKGYPYYTPYQFAGNKPIWAIDLDGLEELTKTQKKVTIVREGFKTVNEKVWINGAKGKFVQTGEEIIKIGDEGAGTLVEETTYYRARYGFDSTTRWYTIQAAPPASDPNNHNKPINPPDVTFEADDRPVFRPENSSKIREKVKSVNLNKVDNSVTGNPNIKATKPVRNVIKTGDIIERNMEGLIFGRVDEGGMEFISRTNQYFPAKEVLQKIVNDVNNSPKIKSITISGFAQLGKGANRQKLQASFSKGLYKLQNILRDLGLRKGVNVNVGSVRSTTSSGRTSIDLEFEFRD